MVFLRKLLTRCFDHKALVLLAMSVFFASFTPRVMAESWNRCECFCGKEGAGAESVGNFGDVTTCRTTCDAKDLQYVSCYWDGDSPLNNTKCWTKTECSSWSDERNGEVVHAKWGDAMPFDCTRAKTSLEEMRYCYSEDVPYDLNIRIGNTASVQNVPEYINVVYAWLLPAATLVAVVMMMLGGLQYMFARGKAKYIDKAKERITNAITGVVLLLSAFVLLNLIDPRLTVFDSLKIPLLKEVVLLDSTLSCERLQDYGYTISPVAGQCGTKGKIEAENLPANTLGWWKVGDMCDFNSCSAEGEGYTCLSDGNCAKCQDIPDPSSSTCSVLNKSAGSDSAQQYCVYDETKNSCVTVEYVSGYGYFNCPSMRVVADASGEHPGCHGYETLTAKWNSGSSSLNSSEVLDLFSEICTNDPCQLREVTGDSSCVLSTRAEGGDFVSTTYAALKGLFGGDPSLDVQVLCSGI